MPPPPPSGTALTDLTDVDDPDDVAADAGRAPAEDGRSDLDEERAGARTAAAVSFLHRLVESGPQ